MRYKTGLAAFLKLYCVSNWIKQTNPEQHDFKPDCDAKMYTYALVKYTSV